MNLPGAGSRVGAVRAAHDPPEEHRERSREQARAFAADIVLAAALLAVDPAGLGGAVLRGRHGPQVRAWLQTLRASLPDQTPWRRMPVGIDDDRLLGGLDIAASLAAGRPMLARGLLAEVDGGVLVMPMAERLERGIAARLCAVLDRQAVIVERDGMAQVQATRLCLLALDEGIEDDEDFSPDLADRMAFDLEIERLPATLEAMPGLNPAELATARARYQAMAADRADAGLLEALCAAAMALGIGSLRAPLFALRTARAHAALEGRPAPDDEDLQVAARLVLAPRATRLPGPANDELEAQEVEQQPEEPPPEDQAEEQAEESPTPAPASEPRDVVLEAVRAALPANLLARLQAGQPRRRTRAASRKGAAAWARQRGRPAGVLRGQPAHGARLHLPSTLKAAAPWQRLRGRLGNAEGERAEAAEGDSRPRLAVRTDDFHVQRRKAKRQMTHIFVVDASGSSAAHRMAEAKGAIELLLAESYVRRDQVALIAFRGEGARVLLPPTRALARARRELAGLPGGGGTPLAAGLDAARDLAWDLERRGQVPVVVVMTDGRANVMRDGTQGHEPAAEEALTAARLLKAGGWSSILVDTSRRPRARARELAEAMGGLYLPLPRADAMSLSGAVKLAAAAP